jgi:SP family general alpha glucoside:H+ symporter-like MFS transporter
MTKQQDAFHVEDEKIESTNGGDANPSDLYGKAHEASNAEHSSTFVDAMKSHPRAVLWSVLVSTAIIMEGYDIVLIGSLFGQSAFQKKYGNYYPGIGYQLSGPWQVGLSNATTVGTIIGAFGNGWFTHKFGYRKVLLTSLMSIIGFIFIPFFAPSIKVLCVGEILCGVRIFFHSKGLN